VIEKELAGWNEGQVKLEKNSVIKLGRVRLRVRNIDYPNDNYDAVESVSDQNAALKKSTTSKDENFTDKQDALSKQKTGISDIIKKNTAGATVEKNQAGNTQITD
jgi:hypothetical protein